MFPALRRLVCSFACSGFLGFLAAHPEMRWQICLNARDQLTVLDSRLLMDMRHVHMRDPNMPSVVQPVGSVNYGRRTLFWRVALFQTGWLFHDIWNLQDIPGKLTGKIDDIPQSPMNVIG